MHETLYKQKKEPLAQPLDPQSLDQGLARHQVGQYMQAALESEQRRPLDLPAAMREKMESRFGRDFSGVEFVQSDLPRKMGADAVAQGNLIRFAPGAFSQTESGERLLSHELSHVIQQSQGAAMDGASNMPYYDAGAEHAADTMAQQAMDGTLSPGEAAQPLSAPAAGQAPMLGNRLFNRLRQKFSGWFGKGSTPAGASPTEVTQAQLGANMYNPTNDTALEGKLKGIRDATTLQEAQDAFGRASGNNIRGQIPEGVSLNSAKRRLKAMTRITHDFPQLAGRIGVFNTTRSEGTMMSAGSTFSSGSSSISWNPDEMGSGVGNKLVRIGTGWMDSLVDFSAANKRYDGVHELGHVLNSLLIEQRLAGKGEGLKDVDWSGNITAQNLIQEALQGVASQNTKTGRKLRKYIDKHGEGPAGKRKLNLANDVKRADDEVDTSTTQYKHRHQLRKMGLTSRYGASDAGEMFAEAFADVYEKGEKANPLSKEIVRLTKGRLAGPAPGAAAAG